MFLGVLNTPSAFFTENYWAIMSNGLNFIQSNNDSDDDGIRENATGCFILFQFSWGYTGQKFSVYPIKINIFYFWWG